MDPISTNSQAWPLWWRIAILANISFYNLLTNAFNAGVTPLFGPLIKDLHCTVEQASHLTTYALLSLGLANLFAMPGVALLGKRHLVLLSQLIFFASNVWAASAPNYEQLLATRFVGGLCSGFTEALGPLYVVETFREKQLSRAMAVYTACLLIGAGIGPLFAGLIAGGTNSWRWFFWVMAIASAANFVASFLMLPETISPSGLQYAPDARPDVEVSKEKNVEQAENIDPTYYETNASAEGPAARSNWWRVWTVRSFFFRVPDKNTKKFSWNPWKTLVLTFSPPVFVSILIYGVSIGWAVVSSIIIAAVFQGPPFLWSAQSIGLFNVSGLIGVVLGIPFGGNLADYLSHRSARKSDGVHHAESRLPALILPGIVSPIGIILMGYFLSKRQVWIGEACGNAMLGFGTTACATVTLSYAVDSFPDRSGEIGVLVNIIKNLIGFGLSYGATNWYVASGPMAQFGTMAGLLWVPYLLAIPLYFFGPTIRKRTMTVLAK